MLIELAGTCGNCGGPFQTLLAEGLIQDPCASCGKAPLTCKPVAGLVYIVSNPHQRGVKIGLSTKSVDQRIKQLNSTGVPGSFELAAYFPSQKPRVDEKKIHAKLKTKHMSKEHYDLTPVDAVLAAYRALNRRRPVFRDGELQRTFELRLEQDRIKMQLKLRGFRSE